MNMMLVPIRILALTFFAACALVAVQAQVQRRPPTFKFPETESEYTVLFPGKPTIRQIYTAEAEGLEARLSLPESVGLRAEFAQLSAEQARSLVNLTIEAKKNLNERRIKNAWEYAETSGLKRAAVRVEDDDRGWCVSVRGYKEFNGVPFIYETKFFYGKHSVMFLTAAAPSSRFPTPAISKFYASLKQH